MPNVPQHVDHELAGRRSIESVRSDKKGFSFQTARRAQGLNLETVVLVQIDRTVSIDHRGYLRLTEASDAHEDFTATLTGTLAVPSSAQ